MANACKGVAKALAASRLLRRKVSHANGPTRGSADTRERERDKGLSARSKQKVGEEGGRAHGQGLLQ